MLTVYSPSGDKIAHERRIDEAGEPVEECVTCGTDWPCRWVLDAEESRDRLVAGGRG